MSSSTATDYDAMVRSMCEAVDAHQFDRFVEHFTDSATYRFANREPIQGRTAIREATAGAAGALPSLRHHVDQVAHVGRQLFCRFTIEVEELRMPCVTVIELDASDKVVDYRAHMDITPALPTIND